MSTPLLILNAILTTFVSFLFLLVVNILPAGAATTFTGSTIEGVDQAHQTITFRTPEGQSWTLGVENADLLKKEQLAKGDHVSIEVDPKSDKVTKILRLAEHTQGEQNRSETAEPSQQ